MASEGDQLDRYLGIELSSREEDGKGCIDGNRGEVGSTNGKNEEGAAASQGSRSPADVQAPSHNLRGHFAQSTPAMQSPYTTGTTSTTEGSTMVGRKQSFPNIRVLQSVPPTTSSPAQKEHGHVPPTGRFATFPAGDHRRLSFEVDSEDWAPLDEITKLPRKPQSSVEPEYEVGSVMWKLRTEPNKSSAQRKTIMSATIEVNNTATPLLYVHHSHCKIRACIR
jgi:hypothetical protein